MPYRHHPLTIALHWLTLLLIVVGVASVLSRELTDDKAIRGVLLAVHRSCGLLVLWGVVIRLLSRWVMVTHEVNTDLPRHIRWATWLVHGLLYLGLVAMPLLGWALTNARGQPVQLLEIFPLPTLLARNRDLAETLESWHQNTAWVLIAFATIHALAALWHHAIRKDDVLRSMLPWRSSSSRSN